MRAIARDMREGAPRTMLIKLAQDYEWLAEQVRTRHDRSCPELVEGPRMTVRPEDDRDSLADVGEALALLAQAETALKATMAGAGDGARELFVDKTGLALSRLLKVWARVRPNGTAE